MKGSQLKWGVIINYGSVLIGLLITLFYTPLMYKGLGDSEYGVYSTTMASASDEDVGEMEENAVLTASAPAEVQAETEAAANPMIKMYAARSAAADVAVDSILMEEAENHAFAAYCIAEKRNT